MFLTRQKVDNIMPTFVGGEEAVRLARKFLSDRLISPKKTPRKESNMSMVSSTITQIGNSKNQINKQMQPQNCIIIKFTLSYLNLYWWISGQEARATRNSISAAFSSMFGVRKSRASLPTLPSNNNPMSQDTPTDYSIATPSSNNISEHFGTSTIGRK